MFSNGLWLEATDGERLLWRTRRLSWDGMMEVRVDGERIVGHAYDPMNDEWTPFAVEIATGEAFGGSYPPGGTGLVRLHPLLRDAWAKVQPDAEIAMHEGSRVICSAVVFRFNLRGKP